jgi:hypothetical protein
MPRMGDDAHVQQPVAPRLEHPGGGQRPTSVTAVDRRAAWVDAAVRPRCGTAGGGQASQRRQVVVGQQSRPHGPCRLEGAVVGVAEPGGTDDLLDRGPEYLSEQGGLEGGRCRLGRELGGDVQVPSGWDGEHAGRRPVEGGGTVVVGKAGAVADNRRARLGELGTAAAEVPRPKCDDRLEAGRCCHLPLLARTGSVRDSLLHLCARWSHRSPAELGVHHGRPRPRHRPAQSVSAVRGGVEGGAVEGGAVRADQGPPLTGGCSGRLAFAVP